MISRPEPYLVSVNLIPADQKRFEAQIVELIRTGKMPSLEQVQAAIESTRQNFFRSFWRHALNKRAIKKFPRLTCLGPRKIT